MLNIKPQYPRQVIIVSCRNKDKDNAITLSWHSPASFDPDLYSIFIGTGKLSEEMIKQSKCFCINFLSKDMKDEALLAGRRSGKDIEKFETLEKEECETINCPRLKKAVAYIECEVIQEVEVGDHTMFVGKITKKDILKKEKRLFQVEGDTFTTTVM